MVYTQEIFSSTASTLTLFPAFLITQALHPYPYSHHHHRRPNTAPNLLNSEWRQDVQLHGGGGDRHDDAMCIERGQMGNSSRWNPSVLHHHSSSMDREEEEDRPCVEWLHQSDDDDDMQDSVMQPCFTSAAAWYHSRVPSASASMDSLGLRHSTPFPVPADYSAISPTYDRTSTCVIFYIRIQPL
jgi:hypothetical protein